MDRESKRNYIKYLRNVINGGVIDATEEQLKYLEELFLDDDCIIGIHNTPVSYESIFDVGLYNNDSNDKKSNKLSNTVMYSSIFIGLAAYPNGDGAKREETAIILKIPKAVFTQEQGIFEQLSNGYYGIPPQFISGAFAGGEVIQNPKYQRDYLNQSAIKCDDRLAKEVDRKSQVEIFNREYQKSKNRKNSFLSKIKSIINRVRNKEKALPLSKDESTQQYRDGLRVEVGDYAKITNTQKGHETQDKDNDER